MFGGDLLFAASWKFIAACDIPILLMPGDDLVHPAEVSADILRLVRKAEVLAPWKGERYKVAAMRWVEEFFVAHEPRRRRY